MNEQQLIGLLDKQVISDVIMTYARTIGRLDKAMLCSVFHSDYRWLSG